MYEYVFKTDMILPLQLETPMTEKILELLEGVALLSAIGRMIEPNPDEAVGSDSTIVTLEVHGKLFIASKQA